MPDYAITGKKGTGKSKSAAFIAFERLKSKRRVASNLDFNLEPMFGPMSKVTYVRVPDKPTAFDLVAVGHGNPDTYDEDVDGALILDELGTWFNSRGFQDKERMPVLDYLAHARKLGWSVYYIMQNVLQIDKQARESFIEYHGRVIRFDRIRIPVVGGLLNGMFGGRAGYLPRMHRLVFRMGLDATAIVAEGHWFRGDRIHAWYDTRQVFRADYPHGAHSVLSPWHVKGRYQKQVAVSWWHRWFKVTAPVMLAPVAKPARLALLMRLPVDERIEVWRRWTQNGLLPSQ